MHVGSDTRLLQVVDFDYRGPVGVILFNHSETDFVGATRVCAVVRQTESLTLTASPALLPLVCDSQEGRPGGAAHPGENHHAAGG